MYTSFAEVYDELMADVDYPAWAAVYGEMLRARGIPTGKVCECACGTGSLTLPLQRAGYQVTGVDISQEMLAIAGEKARAGGLPVTFIRQDMRQLRLHRPVDAVLATCDGVNYLLTESDLADFLASAHAALRPGGALCFDVSTPRKLSETLGNRLLCDDTPDITYLWQNRWHAARNCVDLHLCIFVREKDGRYRRMDEEQRQRAWSREELRSALEKAGFAEIAFYGARRLTAPRPAEDRWHVAAVRPAGSEGRQ